MSKRRTNFHVMIGVRIPREDYREIRTLKHRSELPADAIRRVIRAGITVLKAPENSPVKETAQ